MDQNNKDQGIGRPMRRKEDHRLLTGGGAFSDDLNLEGQAHAVFLRSPHAHALLGEIRAAAALARPGALAVLTGADFLADGLNPIPATFTPAEEEPLARRGGLEIYRAPIIPMVTDKARLVGEIVAVVVADTLPQAKDMAELMEVDYQVLPALVTPAAALAPGAALIWDDAPGNLAIDDARGEREATEAAFAAAKHVATIELNNNRVTGVPMEPRAAIGVFDSERDRHTLYAGSGAPVRHRLVLARVLGLDKEKVRVACKDVGGAFGTRGQFYSEFALLNWAAKRVGRPVKWTCERSEAFLSDAGARDQFTRVELALDEAGNFLALRASHIGNLGSHPVSYVPLHRGISVTTGVYDIPLIHFEVKGVFTNTLPIHTYRGAGRPEAMYLLERLIDAAAQDFGFDRVELRRRNLIPPDAMPYANLTGMVFDSGEFEKNMDAALALADWEGLAARKAEARARGKLLGGGFCNYIETATGIPTERAEMEILPEGRVRLVVGTQDSGQGHATSYAQLITEWLGVPFDDVDLIEGDTDLVKIGNGSHSSRSMRLAGYLLGQARDQVLDKGKRVAAHLLETAVADIGFAGGRFTVAGTDRSLGLFEVAGAVAAGSGDLPGDLPGDLADELGGKLDGAAQIDKLLTAFPNGCHVCEVEIDPETGAARLTRYAGLDDVGRVINPLLVDGQTHGGIAQGVGQALFEECVHDPETGQVLSGSLMDYCLPKALDLPDFTLGFNEVPATNNPLGIKGAGEGGATGAPPAVINAVVDALAEFGVRHVEMPATPEKIWRAMGAGRG